MTRTSTDPDELRAFISREGFALPAAILALAVVAVLIAGGFHMATQEQRVGISSERATQAFYLAEDAMGRAVVNWRPVVAGAGEWELGDPVEFSGARGSGFVRAMRVDDQIFYFESLGVVDEGGALANGASRRVGMMVRRTTADIEVEAALTTQGEVQLRGSSEIHGEDIVPAGWDHCPPAGETLPGVVVGPGGDVSVSGGDEETRLTGDPAWEESEDVGDHTFQEFGGMTWGELVAAADHSFPDGSSISTTEASLDADDECDTSNSENWGYPYEQDDPDATLAPCHDYFPIMHIDGTGTIQSNGYGQGILLVDGDLDLRGNFNFFGIIIVQGQLQTQGGGNPRIVGGAIARNADLDLQTYVGSSVIQYSACSVQEAIENATGLSVVRPLARRSWIDVTGAGS